MAAIKGFEVNNTTYNYQDGNIAEDFSENITYKQNDIIFNDGKLYITNKNDYTNTDWSDENWSYIEVKDKLREINNHFWENPNKYPNILFNNSYNLTESSSGDYLRSTIYSISTPTAAIKVELSDTYKNNYRYYIRFFRQGNDVNAVDLVSTFPTTMTANSGIFLPTGSKFRIYIYKFDNNGNRIDATSDDLTAFNGKDAIYISRYELIDSTLSLSGVAADAAKTGNMIVPYFNETKIYNIGDYVNYNGELYRFKADHAAGAWIGTDAVSVTMANEVFGLNSTLGYDEYLINFGSYTIKASDLESGQWSFSVKSENTARARTKRLLPVRAGMTIAYANTTYDTYFGVLETPTSGSYIQTIGWKTDGSGVVSITKDGWLTFVIQNHSDTSAVVDPAEYDSVVEIRTAVNADIFGGKTTDSDENMAPAITYWQIGVAGFDSTNRATPADIPVNTYCYSRGSRLDNNGKWPDGIDDSVYYYVFCFSPLQLQNIRLYYVICPYSREAYHGHSANSGATVTWVKDVVTDDTLTISGDAADALVCGKAFSRSKALLDRFGVNDLMWYAVPNSATSNGVTFTVNDDLTVTANGTATNIAYLGFYVTSVDNPGLPPWAVKGKTYKVKINSPDSNIKVQVYERDSVGTSTLLLSTSTEGEFAFSQNAVSVNIRLAVSNGATVSNVTVAPSIVETLTLPELEAVAQTNLKILHIGNSYTQDCTTYAPFIMDGLADKTGDKLNITFASCYYSGASIADYNDFFDNESAVIRYNKRLNNKAVYETAKNNQTIQQILADEDWDVITVQQASSYAGTWSTFSGLNELLDKIIGYCASTHGKPVKIGWLMPQLRYSLIETTGSYAAIIDCVEKVIQTTPIDFVIPCGTAIQNARGTSLDAVGDSGHLTYDANGHLQEGLPVLLACYVTALKTLELCGMPYHGILGEQTRPTAAWISAHNIPGQNGSSTGVTDGNCLLAQKCAVAAIKNPFEVTTVG